MESTTIILFWTLAAMLCIMMIVQGLSRRVDIFSIRNIYLAGFIVYQIVSPASALRSGNFYGFRIDDPERAAGWMMLFAYIYVVIYLLSYHRIGLARRLAAMFTRFIGGNVKANDSMLTGVAVSVIIIALAMRLIGDQVLVLRGLSINIAVALAAVACATIGWVWGKKRLNPVVLLITCSIISISMFVSLAGSFSRRPLISILAGFSWGAYHRWARLLAPSRLLLSMLPLILVVVAIVSAFTAIRSHKTGQTAVQDTLTQMKSANIASGTGDLLGGQSSGSGALWILDHYPRDIQYRPLFSIRYMIYWYIPRVLWEDKPVPLGNELATIAKLQGVNRSVITLPPGVIGFAAAEGGFYAIVIYALFFGQFTRLFDEMIKLNPTNPFVILPIGCTTGQFLGLARGDMALFTNVAVVGTVSAFVLLYLSSLAFGRTRASAHGLHST